MKDSNPGVLVKDFIKKHLKIEEDLQNRINELETELKNITESSEDNEYLLYKEILKIMSDSLQITYDADGLYYLSMTPTTMNPELMNALLDELRKYKSKLNIMGPTAEYVDEYSIRLKPNPISHPLYGRAWF